MKLNFVLVILIINFVVINPRMAFAYDWPSNLVKPDLCSLHAETLFLIIGKNQIGKTKEDLKKSNRLKPYVDKTYSDIQKNGLDKTRIETLRDYKICVDRTGSYKKAVTGPCIPVLGTSLVVLQGIQDNVPKEEMLRSWNTTNPDLSEGQDLIKTFYNKNDKEGFSALVTSATISIQKCIMYEIKEYMDSKK